MLVRRQLQSAAHDSSGSLASIGEDTVVENGSLSRAASEDPNADLLRRQSTGTWLRNAACFSVLHACPLLVDIASGSRHAVCVSVMHSCPVLSTADVCLDSRHAAWPYPAFCMLPLEISSIALLCEQSASRLHHRHCCS